MTAYDLAVLLREWSASLPLIAWLDTYRTAHPDATAADAIAAMPTDSAGQGWLHWLEKQVHDHLPLLPRQTYYQLETQAYLGYIRVFDEAAFDRDRQRAAFVEYRARMTPVLVACMSHLLGIGVDANSSAAVRAICVAFEAERAARVRESEVWP